VACLSENKIGWRWRTRLWRVEGKKQPTLWVELDVGVGGEDVRSCGVTVVLARYSELQQIVHIPSNHNHNSNITTTTTTTVNVTVAVTMTTITATTTTGPSHATS
jgi:hypothetical protein